MSEAPPADSPARPVTVASPGRLVIPARYAGPPGSANGGWVAGRLAAYLRPPAALGLAVEVTLRQPPPLDTPLGVAPLADGAPAEQGVRLLFGGSAIAEARPASLHVDPVDPVGYDQAAAWAGRYAGLRAHPFPGCFVCGPERAPGDGLRLTPAPVPDRPGTTAAAWTPPGAPGEPVDVALVWAALDCPGGWALDLRGRPAVLGRITGQVDALPEPGEPTVVMGRALARQGRKTFTASTLYDADGRVLARAHAVWIQVDPARVGRR